VSRERLLEVIRARLEASGFTPHELSLLAGVEAVVRPHGCRVVGIGPEAVNVVGDARAYVPAVVVAFPSGMGWEEVGRISSDVTNRVRVSRVLMEVEAWR
jgi:hypothetical protein